VITVLKNKQMKKHKINIITLGCSKNVVDSENLATQLKGSNLDILFDSNDKKARTVVINTCGFIKDAKEESVNTILEYARAKEVGQIDNLFVIGCLSERYKNDLEKEIPEVDQYFGVHDIQQIVSKLKATYKEELVGERHISTPKHFAYLKVSEGCDRNCSFCAIPLIRGKQVSVPIELLIEQAGNLVEMGVKELILIAQDLTAYGTDLYGKRKLTTLLKELVKIEKLRWIRLHYTYPVGFDSELIKLIASEPKICKYVDIPIQHISESVLKLMRRGHSRKSTLSLLKRLRDEVPGITIRTTLITGHPGEGEHEYAELKEFVEECKFDRLGVFTYSEEEGTFGALNFKDDISEETKKARSEEIMAIQMGISYELNQKKTGNTFDVLIDRQEGDFYVGRTEHDSPEVDNEVLVRTEGKKLKIGEFYKVRIDSAVEYDLYGSIAMSSTA
jgi:ribosomal protein S12 methylthiotransferase